MTSIMTQSFYFMTHQSSIITIFFFLFIISSFIQPSDAYLMELVVEPVFEYSKSSLFSLISSVPRFNSLSLLIANPTSFFLSLRWDRIFNIVFWIFSIVLSTLLLRRLKKFFFDPINRVRLLGEVGYHDEIGSREISSSSGSSSKDSLVASVMKRRKTGDIPPVYPNGWFVVLESRDLKPGDARSISCIGKNLAVFRGEDGTAHILDAYCPHMGANLAVGGVVKKNCLECPFHGWQFRGEDGKCVHVPYCEDKYIPENAKVNSYCCLERNGLILLWFHAEGCEPLWEPPVIEEVTKDVWKYCGRSEHIINAHIEEIPENGADVAHLKQVHGPIMTAGIDLSRMQSKWWSFARHDWVGSWAQNTDPDKKHIGQLDLVHRIEMFGKHFSFLDLSVTALQIGPGLVHLHFESPIFGKGIFIQTLTPIEPLVQRVVHNVYINKRCPTIVAKFFLFGEALMVERDIMIWNNKQYIAKPLLLKSKEDALVGRHRRWYSQFYSEHSPKLMVKSEMDW